MSPRLLQTLAGADGFLDQYEIGAISKTLFQ
jgi:hypothetical protein